MVFRSSDTLRVQGLADFRKEIKELEGRRDIEKELGREFQLIGRKVISAARARSAGLGRREMRLARSFTASRATGGVRVAMGGPNHPDALGAEFGGRGRRTTQQFRQHAGTTGYVLFPTIREKSDETMQAANEAIGRATSKAFPDRS